MNFYDRRKRNTRRKRKTIKKLLVYGGNYGARLLGNASGLVMNYNDKVHFGLGHPFTALSFGAFDLAFDNVPYLKENNNAKILNKVVKLGGLAYFSFLTGKNLVDFALGNYEGWQQLPFNASMATSLGMDVKELFSKDK